MASKISRTKIFLSSLRDKPDVYSWLSILLHWLTASIVITLYFVGESIGHQAADEIAARRSLHITLGLSTWVILLSRIVWRIFMPHPRAAGQTRGTHLIARAAHYTMLALLGVMLLSGPILMWLQSGPSSSAYLAQIVHRTTATLLIALTAVHIIGAIKHLMFHDDETFVRMIWPRSGHR